MDATLRNNALELGQLLEDHQGREVIVMDMEPLDFWTDVFIIATVNSSTHLLGLEKHIKDYSRQNGMEILHRSKRPERTTELRSDEWCLIDLGGIIIHLMSANTRNFFELERLWSAAPVIYQAHSSKSS